MYDVEMDWNKILDYLERGQEFYKIGSPKRKNFVIDYSGWDEQLAVDEVLTLDMFEEVMSKNSYVIMPALSDNMSFTFGELVEVVRRYPRVFEKIRDDEWLSNAGFFRNQFESARSVTDSHVHSFLWNLGEYFPQKCNWWQDSIPFVREAMSIGLGFDEAIPYTSLGVHDASAIKEAIHNDVDPELMQSVFKRAA